MIKTKSLVIAVAGFLSMASCGFASDIRVKVGDIRDTRGDQPFFSKLEVEVNVYGEEVADAKGIHCSVTNAIDDTGRNLLKEQDPDRSTFAVSGGSGSGPEMQRTRGVVLQLRNPSRNATVIRVLAGEIEIYKPSMDSDSTIVATNLLAAESEISVSNSTLMANGIEISMLTEEQWERGKKAAEEKGSEFDSAMAKQLAKLSHLRHKNAVIFQIKDPQSRLMGIELVDESGNPIRQETWTRTGNFRVLTFANAIQKSAGVQIRVATPKSTLRIPFALNDLPLP